MADVATAPATEGTPKGRPEKPDEAKFKADLAAAEKEHKVNQERFNAARTKIGSARSGKSTPQNDRWGELVAEQKEIRTKQAANKSSRQGQQDKYDLNEKDIKNLITQQKEGRGRVGYKNAAEIEAKIKQLNAQVDSGQMKLVDEKKALTEVSSLRRLMKSFDGLDDLQKKIDEKKAANAELKKTFDNAETKQLSDRYEKNQKELDGIKASREDVSKNFDKLKSERDTLYEKQQESWDAMQKLKDAYYKGRKEFKEYEDQLYQQRREKQKAEKDAYEKERRKRTAEAKLEEASAPAYQDEILTAEGLIRHFDSTYGADAGDKGPGKFAASSQRTIDESGFKGMTVMKKDEEDFFTGASKKKGKGKKGAAAAGPESKGFNLSIDLIEGFGKLGVDPPTKQSDVAAATEKLKEKVANWKRDQKSETEKNIEKAQKEIDRLEQEAVDAPAPERSGRRDKAKKVSSKSAGVNGEVSVEAEAEQEKDAVADAAKDLKEAKIEDANGEATA